MNVLFVCTGNTCRSPMAAAIFNKIAMERDLDVRIESAGLFTADGASASAGAVAAMKKYGIDLSEHRSKSINAELLEKSDLILTMTEAHKSALAATAHDKVYSLCEYVGEGGEISDPYGGGEQEYDSCAEALYSMLERVAEKLANN